MKTKLIKTIAVLLFFSVISGCASIRHDYLMKGQVLDVKDDSIAVVCVGLNDGATVGQMLSVYRFKPTYSTVEGTDQFERVDVGKVKIRKIVNEHYANAEILVGEVHKNDIVQLIED